MLLSNGWKFTLLDSVHLDIDNTWYIGKLGDEHPQSFSKLFKTKTNFSPLEFRQSFN
ncbi:hypothetical protein [Mucilaginibacter corticis]|uniref:hypothetical protein n=1 Tax=Mucilaginibacter corticis TaxID=2597670 RepID=UPI003743CC54